MSILLLFLFLIITAVVATAVAAQSVGEVSDEGHVIGAKGGTELMNDMLIEHLPSYFHDRFHIIKSRVREVSTNKTNILWLHDLPNDVESQHLKDPNSRSRFSKIIFVSEWQRQQYQQYFGIPFEQSVVLKNSIIPLPMQPKTKDGTIRLIYHTTPHRGLEILIPTFLQLYEKYGNKISLDVYSSFKIYGWDERDEPYQILFDTCQQHPGCTYHGTVSNEQVRKALLNSHIFAFPSIWQETSCIAAIEALSAGCEIVTSNLGALPETLNGFGTIYPYNADKIQHQQIFAQHLDQAIQNFWDPIMIKKRKMQQLYVARTFDWGFFGFRGRVDEWMQVLASLQNDLIDQRNILKRSSFESDTKYVQGLITAGKMSEVNGNTKKALQLYGMAFELEPQNAHVLVPLGNLCLMYGDPAERPDLSVQGANFLRFALSSNTVTPKLDINSDIFYEMAARVGYFHSSRYEDKLSFQWFDKALTSDYPREDCWEIHRAGSVPHIPRSAKEEKYNLETYHKRMDSLLKRDDLICSNTIFANAFPLAYYDINFKEEL